MVRSLILGRWRQFSGIQRNDGKGVYPTWFRQEQLGRRHVEPPALVTVLHV